MIRQLAYSSAPWPRPSSHFEACVDILGGHARVGRRTVKLALTRRENGLFAYLKCGKFRWYWPVYFVYKSCIISMAF